MRVVIASFGTTGDVLPLCALALELARHGHSPVASFPPHFLPLVRNLGIHCQSYGRDIESIHREVIQLQLAGSTNEARLHFLFSQLLETMPQVFSDLCVLCQDADVLVSTNDPPVGLMVHETTGIPFVSVRLDYPGENTWDHPAKQESINRFRTLLRLPPLNASGPYDLTAMSPQLVLFATSRHVLPARLVLAEHCHVTGFFFHREEAYLPDPDLLAFLEGGSPPIIVSFGSMVYSDPERVSSLLTEAIEKVGRRAIIQMGWAGLFSQQRSSSLIYPIGFVSHSWLFPRGACVVHHGGAGTSAAVLRAGVPGIWVPHVFDQPDLACGVYERGFSGPPLPYSKLTADGLSKAIAEVLSNSRYQHVAHHLRDKVEAERGVETARILIERLVDSVPGRGKLRTLTKSLC